MHEDVSGQRQWGLPEGMSVPLGAVLLWVQECSPTDTVETPWAKNAGGGALACV